MQLGTLGRRRPAHGRTPAPVQQQQQQQPVQSVQSIQLPVSIQQQLAFIDDDDDDEDNDDDYQDVGTASVRTLLGFSFSIFNNNWKMFIQISFLNLSCKTTCIARSYAHSSNCTFLYNYINPTFECIYFFRSPHIASSLSCSAQLKI